MLKMLQGEASSTDPTELVQLVLQPLEDALASRHAAILNLDASDLKILQAIGEGKATTGDIESALVDRLRDLWRRGRIYYDGSTLIVKYLDMVHNLLSRIVGLYFANAERQDGEEALLPMGSTDIFFSNGGVKQPDESFAIMPTGVPGKTSTIVNANLVVEVQDTHPVAREAVVTLLSDASKVHQGLILDVKHGDTKQVIKVLLERWQRGRVVPIKVEDLQKYNYRDSMGEMHPVKAGTVYGVDTDSTYYLRSTQNKEYTRCVYFGLPRSKNPQLCYRTKASMTASYELFGENVTTAGEIIFTVGQLENSADETILVRIPLASLSRKISHATIIANEHELAVLNTSPEAAAQATLEELQRRVLRSSGKRSASELREDSEPPEMEELLRSSKRPSNRAT